MPYTDLDDDESNVVGCLVSAAIFVASAAVAVGLVVWAWRVTF